MVLGTKSKNQGWMDMKIITVIVTVIAAVAMMYLLTFVFGSMFDSIAFASSGAMTFGKPDWVTLAIKRFNLIQVAAIGIVIGVILWGFLNAISNTEYTRGRV